MNKSKVLGSSVLLVYTAFVISQFSNHQHLASIFDALILPIITIGYFLGERNKKLLFIIFLMAYSISDLMYFMVDYMRYDYYYYVGNGLYIVAYIALLIKILKSISFFEIIKSYKLHLFVLIALNIYIAYILQVTVDPVVGKLTSEYFVELVYNIIMLLLLSTSLLNYFYRDNKKALFMFLGSLSIVFSEVIGVAYMYVAKQNLLNFLSTTLTLLAFYFFCMQTKLNNEKVNQLVG